MYKVKKRNFGWYHRRHGILLENLPIEKRELMYEHNFLKFMESDPQTFEVIFRVEDQNRHHRKHKKTYWNPYKETFTQLRQVEKDSNLMDWTCAICDSDIKCRIDHKKMENFVCDECSEVHNSSNKTVDHRIIESSNKFTNHCKKLFKKEQREFFTHIRRDLNAK